MIFLLLKIGAERYAIETARVVEVLPCVKLKAVPHTVPGVAGVLDYHGAPVPVVDLSAMALGPEQRSRDSLSTRLVVVRYTAAGLDDGRQPRLLGLLAEMATETVRFKEGDFQQPGVSAPGAPYLGPVANHPRGLVQRVEIEQLLSPEVRGTLWQQAERAA